jgi:hypothetical protein
MVRLDNFERKISATIVERGRDYFASGQVYELEEEDDGLWRAAVAGSEDYTVTIAEEPDGELDCECTCPYDQGPYCKHEVAVLFAIRDARASQKKTIKTESPGQIKKRRNEQLRAALEKMSREELTDLLMQQLKKDNLLANELLTRYTDAVPDKRLYATMVLSAIRSGKERDGYVDYRGASTVAQGVRPLLEQARALIARDDGTKAIPILQAILENLVPALSSADDSDGNMGGCIEEAVEQLNDAASNLPPSQKLEFLEYCLAQSANPHFSGWDWKWDLLQIAADQVMTEDERTRVLVALDGMKRNQRTGQSRFSDYLDEFEETNIVEIQLSLIERLDGPDKAREFMQKNVHLNSVRETLVQEYIAEKKLATAFKLCKEAIKQYENSAPGLVGHYQRYLLEIAEQEGDTDEVIRLAKDLFLTTQDFALYDLLKRSVPAAEWPEFVERLIQKIPKAYGGSFLAAEVLAREGLWDRLMALVKTSPVIASRHQKELETRFPGDMCAIYQAAVYQIMRGAAGRGDYQKAADLLIRMKMLGQETQAQTIVKELIAQYPKRRAMADELQKV